MAGSTVYPSKFPSSTRGPAALPPASHSLLSLRSRSEFGAVGRYRGLLVPRSHFAVVVRPGRVVFPTDRRVRMGLISASAPLIEFRRPSGPCLVETGRRPLSQRHLPWAFAPYDTCGSRGPVHTGFAYPPPSVLRVWSPSRRFAPSRSLSALFHADSASGILPSELSPPGKSRGRYHRRMPRLPLPSSLTNNLAETRLRHDCGPATGFILPGVPCDQVGCLARRTPDAPLGFSLSGVFVASLDEHFGSSPPARFTAASGYPAPGHLRLGVSIG